MNNKSINKTNKRKEISNRFTRTHDRVVIFVLICGIVIVFISLLCYPVREVNINVLISLPIIYPSHEKHLKMKNK